jgi:hypothetical protein
MNKTDINKTIEQRLTKRNMAFIQYIAKGLSVREAYKLAGYTGTNDQQAYQLRHDLKHKIAEIIEAEGFNKEKLMLEMTDLISRPLVDGSEKVTIDQKIKILRLFKDALPESKKNESEIPRFQILVSGGNAKVNISPNGQEETESDLRNPPSLQNVQDTEQITETIEDDEV